MDSRPRLDARATRYSRKWQSCKVPRDYLEQKSASELKSLGVGRESDSMSKLLHPRSVTDWDIEKDEWHGKSRINSRRVVNLILTQVLVLVAAKKRSDFRQWSSLTSRTLSRHTILYARKTCRSSFITCCQRDQYVMQHSFHDNHR